MKIQDFINRFRDDIKKPEKAVINPKWDANYVQLTTSQVLRLWIINKLILGKNGAEELSKINEKIREEKRVLDPRHNPQPPEIEVYHLAIIVDGEVIDIIRASQKMADYLLLKPDFVLFSPSETKVKVKDRYEEGKFILKNEGPAQDTQA